MTDERLEQVERILEVVRASSPEQREALFQGLEPDLRSEVEYLLASANEDLATVDKTTAIKPLDTSASKRIGPYHLLREIGEGGMGVVYEAEQEKPIRRRVALKLIKWGMDTKAVVARFESERQALALMNHRNIASVHDAGATPEGRPYFAMEYVQGIPITDYCDKHRLTIHERLDLFIEVCEGVQHAHQKGIIHRDIKPSNVLVSIESDRPVPKIIDFGVAKATSQRLTEHTVATELGQLIGTPEYMSPEQAEMTNLDIDTRTDVYSLGVLLYELLVGAQPFDSRELREAGLVEIQRKLREDEPPRPSTRVGSMGPDSATSASNRRVEARALERQLRGDLEWITIKALEKDRTRRYETANALGLDVQRFLNGDPIRARPPSLFYRASKFGRKHRLQLLTAAVVITVALWFLVAYTVGVTRERDRAALRREQAERLITFMLGDFRSKLEPMGRLDVLEEVGDQALDYFEAVPYQELSGEELLRRSQALAQIGQVRRSLGDREAAIDAFSESLSIARQLVQRDAANTDWLMNLGASHFWLGLALGREGELDSALRHYEEYRGVAERLVALDSQRPEFRRELGYTHSNIATVLLNRGELDAATEEFKRGLRIEEELLASDPDDLSLQLDVSVSHAFIGQIQEEQGRFADALESFEKSFEMREGLNESEQSNPVFIRYLGINYGHKAGVLEKTGRSDEAILLYDIDLDLLRNLAERDTANRIWQREFGVALYQSVQALLHVDRLAVAEQRASRGLEIFRKLHDSDEQNKDWAEQLARSYLTWSRVLFAKGAHDAALEAADSAIAQGERLGVSEAGARHVVHLRAQSLLARGLALRAIGREREAYESWEQGLLLVQPMMGETSSFPFTVMRARLLLHLDRPDEARSIVETVFYSGYRETDFVRQTGMHGLVPFSDK